MVLEQGRVVKGLMAIDGIAYSEPTVTRQSKSCDGLELVLGHEK